MRRSPERKAADDKFEDAVREYLKSFNGEGLLMDWVLVTAEHVIEEDGSATGLSVYVSSEQPLHRTVGLLAYAQRRTDIAIARG